MTNQTTMTNHDLARHLRVNLFADRESLNEAFITASNLIDTLDPRDRITALTAMHIVLNTVANILDQQGESK